MQKRWLLCVIAIFAVCAAGSAHADERIVFVDMERVFNEYDKTQMADAQLKKQAEKFAEERDVMIAEVKKIQEECDELRASAMDEALSENAREEKSRLAEERLIEVQQKKDEVKRFSQLRSKQLEDQGKRMRKNIVEEIDHTVSTFARNNGFIAVIDSSAKSINAIKVVMYVDSRYDVTDDVIVLLNRVEE